mmetsp:Transcript_2363/g.8667  ORF Transcript_2363/g.8667 Transcript_2363/m.8667 type:complete len:455 (+) Transcript_2363:489-1853(+)
MPPAHVPGARLASGSLLGNTAHLRAPSVRDTPAVMQAALDEQRPAICGRSVPTGFCLHHNACEHLIQCKLSSFFHHLTLDLRLSKLLQKLGPPGAHPRSGVTPPLSGPALLPDTRSSHRLAAHTIKALPSVPPDRLLGGVPSLLAKRRIRLREGGPAEPRRHRFRVRRDVLQHLSCADHERRRHRAHEHCRHRVPVQHRQNAPGEQLDVAQNHRPLLLSLAHMFTATRTPARLFYRGCFRTPTARTHAAAMPIQFTDEQYPGTATARLRNAVERARAIESSRLNGDWEDCRKALLEAGGLRDLRDVPPGMGNTCHCFNDHNHTDLTTMMGEVAHNENDGAVAQIAQGNLLGPGIEAASVPELGPGGSWCTCTNGAHHEPPRDVAHVQFRSRIAFKLVWCPPAFESFVLVDDAGELLNRGTPTGSLPDLRYRQENFRLVQGGRYATAAQAPPPSS